MASGYDVVVVGLGHAGCEAALACARMGLSTLGVTLKADRIAVMSCNPAIGGTGKGHLVRELDALGGQMARAADLSGTHFKTLNASKGPAVRATRVLCDRDVYAHTLQAVLRAQQNLDIIEAEVSAVWVENGRVGGVELNASQRISASAVLLTTGTFLQGLMHVGEERREGGRLGDAAAVGMSACLRELGFTLGRFKTGTPARLSRKSIDFSRCEAQPGDEPPKPFSLRTQAGIARGEAFPRQPNVLCYLTHTTRETHALVEANLQRSPLFRGNIVGRGPRYCPSLEDKVVRFRDKERHAVFLEPEGPESDLVYPAGLSTSLPADVQVGFLRTIDGLENVEVVRYGYAVEYDYAPPTQLSPTLETQRVPGMYFAGQLNGTSGYEEAAFQGLIAGVNAALKIRGEAPFILGRHEAHGAVLIDDLVTRGVDEPFRMFTSRAEHRLRLREGNADLRLRHHGFRLGLVTKEELEKTEARAQAIQKELDRLRKKGLTALLRRPERNYASLAEQDPERPNLSWDVVSEVEVDVKYEGYIAQAERFSRRSEEDTDGWVIPSQVDFKRIPGLSVEAVEKLSKHQPSYVGQARKIPGLTPAAISLLLVHLKRARTPGSQA